MGFAKQTTALTAENITRFGELTGSATTSRTKTLRSLGHIALFPPYLQVQDFLQGDQHKVGHPQGALCQREKIEKPAQIIQASPTKNQRTETDLVIPGVLLLKLNTTGESHLLGVALLKEPTG